MKKINKAYTLVEVIIYLFLISTSSFYIILNYTSKLYKLNSYTEKVKIINFLNYALKKSINDKIEYTVNFNLNQNRIEFLNEIINLDNNYIFESKNINNNFSRKITKNGNFDKGFTIMIKSKNNKIYHNIVVNTANGLKRALINEKD